MSTNINLQFSNHNNFQIAGCYVEDDELDYNKLVSAFFNSTEYIITKAENLKQFSEIDASKLDFAYFDVRLADNETSLLKAYQTKKNFPKLLVGFITNNPIDINRRYIVDFILYKNYINDTEEYNTIILYLTISHKLFYLKNLLIQLFDDEYNTQMHFYDIKDSYLKIASMNSSLSSKISLKNLDVFLDEFQNIIDKSFTNSNEIYIYICTIDSILLELNKSLCSYKSIRFFKQGKEIITSDDLISFDSSHRLIQRNLGDILKIVDELQFNKIDVLKYGHPICFEVNFSISKHLDLDSLLEEYLNFHVYNGEFEIHFDFYKEKLDRPLSNNVVPFAIYPSGAMKIFGNISETDDSIIISSPSLESYFDPMGEYENEILPDPTYRFWIVLMEF